MPTPINPVSNFDPTDATAAMLQFIELFETAAECLRTVLIQVDPKVRDCAMSSVLLNFEDVFLPASADVQTEHRRTNHPETLREGNAT